MPHTQALPKVCTFLRNEAQGPHGIQYRIFSVSIGDGRLDQMVRRIRDRAQRPDPPYVRKGEGQRKARRLGEENTAAGRAAAGRGTTRPFRSKRANQPGDGHDGTVRRVVERSLRGGTDEDPPNRHEQRVLKIEQPIGTGRPGRKRGKGRRPKHHDVMFTRTLPLSMVLASYPYLQLTYCTVQYGNVVRTTYRPNSSALEGSKVLTHCQWIQR